MERASLLADHGDYAGAIADLDRLKMLDPANDQQMALRGSILRRSGQPGAARQEQEAFLQKHPGQAQVQFDYCRTLIDLQDSAAAIAALDKVITNAKAPSPDAVALRIKVTEAAGESGPSEALKWVKGFLQKHPLPVFEEEALRLELKTGRTADALHRMDAVLVAPFAPMAVQVTTVAPTGKIPETSPQSLVQSFVRVSGSPRAGAPAVQLEVQPVASEKPLSVPS